MDFQDIPSSLILDSASGTNVFRQAFQMQIPHGNSIFHIECRILENNVSLRTRREAYAHPHPLFVRVWFFKHGSARLWTITGERILKEGHLYILPPGFRFRVCYEPGELIYYHLLLNDGNDLSILSDQDSIMDFQDSRLLRMFDSAQSSGNPLKKYAALTELFSEVIPDKIPDAAIRFASAREFRRIFEHLRETPPATATVKALAELCGIQESALSKRFRRKMGIPLKKFLTERLFSQACAMLLYSPLNIQETAKQLGFENIQYFFRFFRRHTGMTPMEFRRRKS